MSVVLATASASTIPTLLSMGIDGLRSGEPVAAARRIGAVMIAVTLGTGALRYLMREVMNGLSRHVEYDLRNALFARLLTLDAAWFAQMRTGDIMARLTNDLGAVRMAVGPAVMYLANTMFGGLFALWCMSRIDLARGTAQRIELRRREPPPKRAREVVAQRLRVRPDLRQRRLKLHAV